MQELKDILTEEELELATKMINDLAKKVLLDFSNQKEALATEIQKLKDEDMALKAEYMSISEWKPREVIMNKRSTITALLNYKTNQLKNIDNQLKALTSGGTVVEFEDKTGKVYKGVPDFRNVKTDKIIFDPETILVEPAPDYIPFIDEGRFEKRGAVLDAIRYTNDTYVVSYSDYQYGTFENQSQVFLVTLDQLVLINLYYLTKLKAVYKKNAEQKTEKAKEYYFSLSLERREKHYAQRGFYQSLNKTLQKKYSEQEWNDLSLSEKEKLSPAYKVYGSEKIKSKLESTEMYSSFHDMYNVFINPEFLRTASNKTTRLKIGESAFGAYAHPLVFKYWRDFREMMEYKFKDIEFQRAEMSENYKTAIETSFGESNTENYLYADYGVLIKRQNGDKINASETEQIENGLIYISKVFGNLKDQFIQNNMKISHTGKKLVFAQKAVGVYIPSMGTIAVSDKYGEIQFNSTFAHELAHFIDNKLGQKNGKRWETDNFESTAGIIAFTFRNNLNKPKEQQTDYINATKECFARAMQQYFVMQKYGDDVEIVYGYGNFSVPEKIANQEVFVNQENFNSKIKPLIEQFLQENKDFFSAELQMKKVVQEIKETTAEIVPILENKEPKFEEIIDLDNNFEIRVEKVFYENGDSTYGAYLYYKNKLFKYFVTISNTTKKQAIDNVYNYLKTLRVSDKIIEDKQLVGEYGNKKTIPEYKVFYNDRGGENLRREDSKAEIEQFIFDVKSVTKAEIVPIIENKGAETNELQEAIETLQMLLETLPDNEKQEVEEALEVLEMLNGNSFEKGGLIAPNGKKSNLNAEQYKLVRTPEFKAWFGDWENDPENSSKVVDENGEPMVVYHGTNVKFNEFKSTKFPTAGYFAKDIVYSKSFARTITEYRKGKETLMYLFLNIRKPFDTSMLQGDKEYSEKDLKEIFSIFNNIQRGVNYIWGWMGTEDVINAIKENGYDGIIFNEMSVEYWKEYDFENEMENLKTVESYIAFEPNQIKLADGTNTTFDPYSNDIRYDNGGSLSKGISVEDIAKMHNVSMAHIKRELTKGKKVESEHTSNKRLQEKIAKDHLVENPNYYTILAKVGL